MTCRAVELPLGAPSAYIFLCFLLKMGLQSEGQTDTDKRIPSVCGLMVDEHDLQSIVLINRVFNALNFAPTLEQS